MPVHESSRSLDSNRGAAARRALPTGPPSPMRDRQPARRVVLHCLSSVIRQFDDDVQDVAAVVDRLMDGSRKVRRVDKAETPVLRFLDGLS